MSTSDTFDALTSELIQDIHGWGCPCPPQLKCVAGQLLLLGAKGDESLPAGGELRLAACLFVLFVQENLVHSRQHILGTDVQEIYVRVHQLLHRAQITRKAFVHAVEGVDLIGTATGLLRHQEVTNALFAVKSIDAFWVSEARSALEAIDEMEVLTEGVGSLASENQRVEVQPSVTLQHAVSSDGSELRLAPLPHALAARPRLRSLTGAMAFCGVLLGIGAVMPIILQGPSDVDTAGIIGRDNCTTTGCLPETSPSRSSS